MFIDSNIFLELFLGQNKADECQNFLEKVNKGEILCTVSDFNIDNILLILSREVNTELLEKALESIISYSGLSIYSLTVEDRMKAISHMQKHKLDFEDALTFQAVLSSGNTEIISFDKHFDNLLINRIEPKSL